jgi:NAD(P)H-hydrate epimerase
LFANDHDTPIVLDADALNLIASKALENNESAAMRLSNVSPRNRQIVCTPHLGEFSRLLNESVPADTGGRVELAQSFAMTSRTTVLLKGSPTVVCPDDGAPPIVVARGNPALSTGGSGDMLTGIVTTLLSQGISACGAAALGAWLHGRAAEIAALDMGTVRGIPLEYISAFIPAAWREVEQPASFPPYVLAELAAVSPRARMT